MTEEIAVLGGTFDPPTQAHFRIAEGLASMGFSRLLIVMSGRRPDKAPVAPPEKRLKWVNYMKDIESLYPDCKIEVDPQDIDQDNTPTVALMRKLRLKYPEPKYMHYFCIGSDYAKPIPGHNGHSAVSAWWDKGLSLLSETQFVIIPRPEDGENVLISSDFDGRHKVATFIPPPYSSSRVRELIQTGKNSDWIHMLTPEIAEDILEDNPFKRSSR